MDKEFKNSVLSTLAYFDIFKHPLESRELYFYLWGLERKMSYYDFLIDLKEMVEKNLVEFKNGYYFFSGRSDLIKIRESKVRYLDKKMKIAKRGVKLIRFIPFVRAVFVCNTVASSTAGEGSDIDLFIIIKHGRIWLSRFLVIVLFILLRLRITKKKMSNKFCLSFFITDKNLDLSRVSIPGDDIYLAYWISHLIPVYDPDNFLKRIIKENGWVKNILRHFGRARSVGMSWNVNRLKRGFGFVKFFEKIWGTSYGDLLESQSRGLQMSKMRKNKSIQNELDNRVVINDEMLKFHENDRREFYRTKWQEKCVEYGVFE
ncbi:MAG: hypothetical protein L3J07_00090 [Candidatus Magasanikbacteria bacterium]|nr:hypothetical protein [Candidatus Magasanikbacteria bacterium]